MTNLEILKTRHSVRAFTEEEIPAATLNKLRAEVTMTNTHEQGMRFQLITDDPDPLSGFSGSYGVFTNPRNYLAAVVDTATPDAYERAGYFAERFAIKAVSLGLGTCFVGGTYDSKKVKAQKRAGERILFIVLIGYPAEKTKFMARLTAGFIHLRKKGPEDFFEPKGELPEAEDRHPELKDGLEAVACAPSALNRRPARITVKDGELCAGVKEGNEGYLIDLGIVKFNFNYATATECEWGNWGRLNILGESKE